MKTIKVPAGIGDNIWLLMKLKATGQKFKFQLPDGKPQRGKQIFDLLPSMVESAEYVPGLSYKMIKRANLQRFRNYWRKVREHEMSLSMNEHLEAGFRIESYFPDLPTSFSLPYETTDKQKEDAAKYFPEEGATYIGIYGSSYSTARAWNFWDEDGWYEFVKMMYAENPKLRFILIGAEWDMDLNKKLFKKLSSDSVQVLDSTGEDLGTVVEILKGLELFCGFPSGLSILNETIPGIKSTTLMFYPEHLVKMKYAWADPIRIENGDYIPCDFCAPFEAFPKIQHIIFSSVKQTEDHKPEAKDNKGSNKVDFRAEKTPDDLKAFIPKKEAENGAKTRPIESDKKDQPTEKPKAPTPKKSIKTKKKK